MKKTPVTGYDTAKCAKCGACSAVCPLYQVTGKESMTARGKLHLINNPPKKRSAAYAKIFSQCLLCGACEAVCSRGIKITESIVATREATAGSGEYHRLRQLTARKTLASPFLLKQLGRTRKKLAELPEESGLFQKLMSYPPNLPSLPQPSRPRSEKITGRKGQINYFSGCLANYLAPDIKTATINLVQRKAGYDCLTNEEQTCCGLTSLAAGKSEEARKMARLNIEAFENNNDPVLVSCASCYTHMKNYPSLLSADPVWEKKARMYSRRLRELSSFMVEEIPEAFDLPPGQERIRVAIHDPCHLLFGKEKITEAPRKLLKKISNISLREIPRQCCGQGGLFQMTYPELSRKIAEKRIKDLSDNPPEYLLTTCSGCLLQLNRTLKESELPVRAYHLSVFINWSLEFHK